MSTTLTLQPTSAATSAPAIVLDAAVPPLPSTSLLPPPGGLTGVSSASIETLAILLTKVDERDRAAARDLERSADHAAAQADDAHVHELLKKAEDDHDAAQLEALGDIVSGAFTCASAAFCTTDEWHTLNRHTLLEGASKGAPGILRLVASGAKAEANQDDAQAARLAAYSQASVRQSNEAHDAEQAARASIQKVQQLLGEIKQSSNATMLAIAAYRA